MPTVTLDTAAKLLATGQLVAFATETVYGLGGDATNGQAVAQIYHQKGRPQFNPLIVHFSSLDEAKEQVIFNTTAEKLVSQFWPGPLTLVLNRRADCSVSNLCSAGGPTLAVRIPHHPLAQELIRQAGCPVAAPSANSSGKISPTSPTHVLADFGADFPVLDGGVCDVGLESTVIDVSNEEPRILRPGAITAQMLEDLLGTRVQTGPAKTDLKTHKSPGMLSSHYAPDKPLRINVTSPDSDEFFVGFGGTHDMADLDLSPKGDLVEAASNLFDALHLANKNPLAKIAFAPIPNEGIGIAINDRLNRAAAPR